MFFNVRRLSVDGDFSPGYVTDNRHPIFSWAAEHSESGKYQSEYRVTVKSSSGIEWDSGWVKSRAQKARYAGEEFSTGEKITWAVVIKDNDGLESDLAENYFFAAHMDNWSAPWITTPWDNDTEPKYFLKTFSIEEKVKRAWLYVCGIGYQFVTVNGVRADNAYLQPAVSDYEKQCYYISLPVQEFLTQGENRIEVTIGDGWRRNNGEYLNTFDRDIIMLFGVPKLTAVLKIEYESGNIENYMTDASWLCGKGPTVSSHLFDGEVYDERIKTEYTDNAVVLSDDLPRMRAQTIPPITAHERLKPIMKTRVGDGYVFDFGTNIAGIVEVNVPADMPKGTVVRIHHAENIMPDGSLDKETLRRAKVIDTFICGNVAQSRTWYPKFTYHGFRYIYAMSSSIPRIPGLLEIFIGSTTVSPTRQVMSSISMQSSFLSPLSGSSGFAGSEGSSMSPPSGSQGG